MKCPTKTKSIFNLPDPLFVSDDYNHMIIEGINFIRLDLHGIKQAFNVEKDDPKYGRLN